MHSSVSKNKQNYEISSSLFNSFINCTSIETCLIQFKYIIHFDDTNAEMVVSILSCECMVLIAMTIL